MKNLRYESHSGYVGSDLYPPLGNISFGATTYVTTHLRYVESAQVSLGVKEHPLSGTVKVDLSLGLVSLSFEHKSDSSQIF